MNSTKRTSVRHDAVVDPERRREEVDWMLSAIVGAIVTDKLPPNDAFAWARIAAHEAARMSTLTDAVEG
jgi:hypothetical protein